MQTGTSLRLPLHLGRPDMLSNSDAQDHTFPRGKAQLDPRPQGDMSSRNQRTSHAHCATSRPMSSCETRIKKKNCQQCHYGFWLMQRESYRLLVAFCLQSALAALAGKSEAPPLSWFTCQSLVNKWACSFVYLEQSF